MFNFAILWGVTKIRNNQEEINLHIWKRLNYLEVGMSHHGLIPMPWEVEDMEDIVDEIKAFKQEGNVVYLQRED